MKGIVGRFFFDLKDVPLYAKAGSIIPMQAETTQNRAANPAKIDLHVFPGADGTFTLYEDDGTTQDYLEKGGATTCFTSHQTESSLSVTVSPVDGEILHIPAERTYRILFRGVSRPERMSVWLDGRPFEIKFTYDPSTSTAGTELFKLAPNQELKVEMSAAVGKIVAEEPDLKTRLIPFLLGMKVENHTKWKIGSLVDDLQKDLGCLIHPQIVLTPKQRIALIEMITGCGTAVLDHPQYGKKILLVNPTQNSGFRVKQHKLMKIDPRGSLVDASKAEMTIDYFGVVKKKI